MMRWQKDNTILQDGAGAAGPVSAVEPRDQLIVGLLAETADYPEYTAEYRKLIDRLAKEGEAHDD
jgi:hypothetical protein